MSAARVRYLSYRLSVTFAFPAIAGVLLFAAHSIVLPAQEADARIEARGIAYRAIQGTNPLVKRLSIHIDAVPLNEALQLVANRGNVKLTYGGDVSSVTRKVSVTATDESLESVLARMLKGTGISYRLAAPEQIFLFKLSMDLPASQEKVYGSVHGTVIDSASGKGVAGATVTIVGTKLVSVTDDKGSFVFITVPVGTHVVAFKVLGFSTVTRNVEVGEGKRVNLRVIMHQAASMLSGVVTTATGKQRRVEVGNDITVLNVDSIQQIAPISTVTDLLANRVPGLTVLPTSGIPGAPSRLRLRGVSGLTTSDDPIIIVDGVRVVSEQSGSKLNQSVRKSDVSNVEAVGGSGVKGRGGVAYFAGPAALDQIDPNSIEKIEVFKGPSASAIYGSDAANGIIVVTTKRGRSGTTRFGVVSSLAITTLPGEWPASYFRIGHESRAQRGAQLCSPYSGLCIDDTIVAYQALNDPALSPLKTGQDRNLSMTISGGQNSITYSLIGSWQSRDGYLRLPGKDQLSFRQSNGFAAPEWMVNPDRYQTYSASSRIDFQTSDSRSTAAVMNSVFISQQQQSSLQGVLQYLRGYYPGLMEMDYAGVRFNQHYYTRAQLGTVRSNNTLELQWQPFSWLPVRTLAGLDNYNTDNNSVLPRGYCRSCTGTDSLGSYSLERKSSLRRSFDISTTVRRLKMITTSGISVSGVKDAVFSIGQNGLQVGEMEPSTFSNTTTAIQRSSNTWTYGWYISPTLDLKSRFFVNPGFRFDGGAGASGISGNNVLKNPLNAFPKLSFSYLAVDRGEDDPLWKMITLFRPRFAFGIAGVQPSPEQKLRTLMVSTTASPEGVPWDIATLDGLGNRELEPERSKEFEGGFEIELWNRRITLSATEYSKTRYKAILGVSLSPSLGAFPVARNIGTIRNRGTEVEITTIVSDRTDFSLSVKSSFSANDNKILKLLEPEMRYSSSTGLGIGETRVLKVGYPVWSVFARPLAAWHDDDGSGIIDPDEIRVGDSAVYVGASQPRYQISSNISAGFLNNRIAINASAAYQHGMTQRMGGGLRGGAFDPVLQMLNNPAISPAQQAAIGAYAGLISEIGLYQVVSVLRFTTLAISYNATARVARLLRAQSLSMSLQGSNLGLKTNYRGKDPMVNSNSSGNFVNDNGVVPPPRIWLLRVSLSR